MLTYFECSSFAIVEEQEHNNSHKYVNIYKLKLNLVYSILGFWMYHLLEKSRKKVKWNNKSYLKVHIPNHI